jgi:hypothetical protein
MVMKKDIFKKKAKRHTKIDKDILLQLESRKSILDRINIIIGDSTCVGDVATNKAQGEVDIIGKPKKKKKKKYEEEEEEENG